MLPVYVFVVVFLLFQFEYVLYEELLQILVRVIYTKLFKAENDQVSFFIGVGVLVQETPT